MNAIGLGASSTGCPTKWDRIATASITGRGRPVEASTVASGFQEEGQGRPRLGVSKDRGPRRRLIQQRTQAFVDARDVLDERFVPGTAPGYARRSRPSAVRFESAWNRSGGSTSARDFAHVFDAHQATSSASCNPSHAKARSSPGRSRSRSAPVSNSEASCDSLPARPRAGAGLEERDPMAEPRKSQRRGQPTHSSANDSHRAHGSPEPGQGGQVLKNHRIIRLRQPQQRTGAGARRKGLLVDRRNEESPSSARVRVNEGGKKGERMSETGVKGPSPSGNGSIGSGHLELGTAIANQ